MSSDPSASAPSSPRAGRPAKTVAELGEEYDRMSTELLMLSREHAEIIQTAESVWKRMSAEHAELQRKAKDVWDRMKLLKDRRHIVMRSINDTITMPSPDGVGKKKKNKKLKKPGAPSMLSRPRRESGSMMTY